MKRAVPEMRVYCLPEPDEILLPRIRYGGEFREIRPFRRQFARCLGEGAELFWYSKTVRPALVVEAQDHAVGDIERQRAARQPMWRPLKRHGKNYNW